jgi:hypothetical protein
MLGLLAAWAGMVASGPDTAQSQSTDSRPEYGHLFTVTPQPLVRGSRAHFLIELFEFSTSVDDLHVTLDSASPALRLSRDSRPAWRRVGGKPRWKLAPLTAGQAENAYRRVSMYFRLSARRPHHSRACLTFTIHAANGDSSSDRRTQRCYRVVARSHH